MAGNKYHNLAGWVRDVMACLEADDDEYAGELFTMLARIVLEYAPEWFEVTDPDLPDADEGSGGVGDADVDVRDPGDSGPLGGAAPGHDPLREPPMGGARKLDGEALSARASELSHAAVPSPARTVVRAELGRRVLTHGQRVKP